MRCLVFIIRHILSLSSLPLMGIPVILATAAACGSLVTTMKSGWELSRMIRQKRDERQAEEDAVRVYRSLRRALHSGRMTDKEYDHWFEKFLVAESEKNREQLPLLCIASVCSPYGSVAGLRKIRAHLRIINDNSEKRPYRNRSRSNRSRSRSSNQTRGRYDEEDNKRQRQSVRFDMRKTYYVPDPPQRYQDVEWPQSAGSIEYFPLKDRFSAKEKAEPGVVRLARLQRSSSVSYCASDSPRQSHERRSESADRHERGRGRSRRRETRDVSTYASSDSSDEFYHEKLGYRSKR